MKVRSRYACLSAAVAALAWGGSAVSTHARDLVWDFSPGDGVPNDGTGTWDLSSPNWVDTAVPGVNTVWQNPTSAAPTVLDSAIFGSGNPVGADGSPPYNVDLASHIQVQDVTLAEVPGNQEYSITSFNGGSLTLHGNLHRTGNDGRINFFASTILSAGNHNVRMEDTGGDVVELIFNGDISGAGGLTIDNQNFEAWGTLALNRTNSYTGVTNINKGRLLLTDAGGLGSSAPASGTVIGANGTLAFYGAGTFFVGNLNVNEPIRVTRDTYAGTDVRYSAAIQNNAGANTLSGPFVIDSAEARVDVNSGSLTISSNIQKGTTVVGPAVISVGGGFGGELILTGNNTGMPDGIKIIRGSIVAGSHANIGGPNAPINFAGDGYLRINNNFMTTFGSHPVNTTSFGGGIDTPDLNQVFTVNENLTGTQFNKRGLGKVVLNGVNTFTTDNFTDAGTTEVNGTTTARAIRMRNGTVVINPGGRYVTTGSHTSIGVDTGETGALIVRGALVASNNDFNVSDNQGTTGTMTVIDGGSATVAGPVFIAKNNNTSGTLNIAPGSTFNGTLGGSNNGNGVFTIGRGTGAVGVVNNGGTLNLAGEMWVGNNGGGNGTFNQTAGSTTVNTWIAVARNTATGSVNLSGSSTLTKTGGGNTEIDFGGGGSGSLTMADSAVFNVTSGEFWVGNSGGANATLTMSGNAAITTNNWTVVARQSNSTGVATLMGNASITKASGGGNHFIVADNGNGTLSLLDSSRIAVNAGEIWVGQGGSSTGILNVNSAATGAAVSVNSWFAIGREGGNGTVNLTNGAIVKTGSGNRLIIAAGNNSRGTVNQTGGSITHTTDETWITEAGNGNPPNTPPGTGTGVWNMSAGSATLARLDIGRNGGTAASATLNVGSAASLTATIIRFGESGGVRGTLNLDGGTIAANQIVNGNSTGTKIFNINGGVIRARQDQAAFFQGLTAANIGNNGVTFDSNGFNVTANQAFTGTGTGAITKVGAGNLTLAGANTHSGGTVVNAGTLTAGHHDALGTAGLTVNGATASTTRGLASAIKLPSLALVGPAAKLDLTDNDLVLDYADGGPSPLASVRGWILAAAGADNLWAGAGITSTAAADLALHRVPGPLTALAYDEASAFMTRTGLTSLGNRTLDTSAVLVKYTYAGDATMDGLVTDADVDALVANFNNGSTANSWTNADFTYDGVVNDRDLDVLASTVGAGPQFSISPAGAARLRALYTSAVPEPAALPAVALAAAAFSSRRRRRSAARHDA